jgi:fructose-bisphosphate aldolase class II
MSRTPAAPLLQRARRHGHALAAFNAVNLETAEAIVVGAEQERAPVILQVSQNAVRYSRASRLAAIGRTLRDEASVPVILHFDHAESVDTAREALDLGFDSVMLEARHGMGEAYATSVRELAALAHDRGAMVEAELEIVRKGDRRGGDPVPTDALRAFADRTACDSFAIDIGTAHKQARKEAQLDLDRLDAVARALPHPLVLHGSSGVTDEALRAAVSGGITKVNLFTALMLAFTSAVRASLANTSVHDPRDYLGPARERMTDAVRGYIRLLGSAGTAAEE